LLRSPWGLEETTVWQARGAVSCLWLSQTARVAADNALRFFVVLLCYYGAYRNTAWYLATLLFMLPAVLLAPVNGAISNSLPKPAVLIGAAALSLAATVAGTLGLGRDAPTAWLVVWAIAAVAAALYGPTRYAMLPAASNDTRWPLSRLNGFFEMGAAGGVVGGMLLALRLHDEEWLVHPAVPALAAVLGVVAFAFVLPVHFTSDVRRPDSALTAIRGFFTDARAVAGDHELRICLIGLALLRAIVTGLTGALMPRVLTAEELTTEQIADVFGWVMWIMAGLALGALAAGLVSHPRRVLGLVPLGALGLAICLVMAAGTLEPHPALLAALGGATGLINVPLASTYQADLPADARGNGMAIRNFADYLAVALATGLLAVLAGAFGVAPASQMLLLAAVVAMAGVYAAWFFRRPAVELPLAVLFTILYRIRATGPGLDAFPRRGPVLVIANHCAWLDPLWLGKVLPRPLVVMMTSHFFDLPILRWLVVHFAGAIRVEAGKIRREVPELRAAVAALDRGDCLVVFPEGRMRRRDEVPLRMFGQGVWHILRERPNTPVVVCWIEGSWGSFFSYRNGPPTKNKPFDWRRLIRIAVGAAHLVPEELLADQRATRLALMRECLQMRQHLGLEPFALMQEGIDEDEASIPR
jgi:1-acyl-sn-glycerol-3-phosphate acyltransferase